MGWMFKSAPKMLGSGFTSTKTRCRVIRSQVSESGLSATIPSTHFRGGKAPRGCGGGLTGRQTADSVFQMLPLPLSLPGK